VITQFMLQNTKNSSGDKFTAEAKSLIFWSDFVRSKVSRYFKTHLFVN